MTLRMQASLTFEQLAALAVGQCDNLIPDNRPLAIDALMTAIPRAMQRLEHCFQAVDNKYFFDGRTAIFSHLHGDQYCMWLYILANELYRQGESSEICSKLFILNRALHGCDIFYEVDLPSIFLVVHPLGTVLGRGIYSDYFVSYQRVSVGSNHDIYPRLGQHVTLRPGAAILGECSIGDMSQIAADSLVLDRNLPSNSLYIGNPKTAVIKPNRKAYLLWRQ